MSIVVPDIHIWPVAATEGTVELGLVRILQAQRVVAHGRLGLPTPRPGNVLVHALVDDDPMTFDRPFERQHVTVAVCRQIVGRDTSAIGNQIARLGAHPEIASIWKSEHSGAYAIIRPASLQSAGPPSGCVKSATVCAMRSSAASRWPPRGSSAKA